MSVSLVIPVWNQLQDIKGVLGLLRNLSTDKVEWVIIDNGSTEDIEGFIRSYLRPKRMNYVKNKENVGCFRSMNQGLENASGDIVVYAHSDTFIYQPKWDEKIEQYFKDIDKLGIVGLFGAKGTFKNGGRLDSWTSMLEAEIHGRRLEEDYKPVSIFDAFFMACSKEMLEEAGGIDEEYIYHHFQDRELSMLSLSLGYRNIVANIPCHHWNGITANRDEYQNWVCEKLGKEKDGDLYCHNKNMERWNEKWADKLPIYIDDDFNFVEKVNIMPEVEFKKW